MDLMEKHPEMATCTISIDGSCACRNGARGCLEYAYTAGPDFRGCQMSRARYLVYSAALHAAQVGRALEDAFMHRSVPSFAGFGTLKVLSLGGGPGTDILGVLDAMKTAQYANAVDAQIFDKVAEWTRAGTPFLAGIDRLSCTWKQEDLCTGALPAGSADIVVMSYFLSELLHNKSESEKGRIVETLAAALSSVLGRDAIVVINDIPDSRLRASVLLLRNALEARRQCRMVIDRAFISRSQEAAAYLEESGCRINSPEIFRPIVEESRNNRYFVKQSPKCYQAVCMVSGECA